MASTLWTTAVRFAVDPASGPARMLDRLPPTFSNVSTPERWASVAAGGL